MVLEVYNSDEVAKLQTVLDFYVRNEGLVVDGVIQGAILPNGDPVRLDSFAIDRDAGPLTEAILIAVQSHMHQKGTMAYDEDFAKSIYDGGHFGHYGDRTVDAFTTYVTQHNADFGEYLSPKLNPTPEPAAGLQNATPFTLVKDEVQVEPEQANWADYFVPPPIRRATSKAASAVRVPEVISHSGRLPEVTETVGLKIPAIASPVSLADLADGFGEIKDKVGDDLTLLGTQLQRLLDSQPVPEVDTLEETITVPSDPLEYISQQLATGVKMDAPAFEPDSHTQQMDAFLRRQELPDRVRNPEMQRYVAGDLFLLKENADLPDKPNPFLVAEVQRALVAYGYDDVSITGVANDSTFEALAMWKRSETINDARQEIGKRYNDIPEPYEGIKVTSAGYASWLRRTVVELEQQERNVDWTGKKIPAEVFEAYGFTNEIYDGSFATYDEVYLSADLLKRLEVDARRLPERPSPLYTTAPSNRADNIERAQASVAENPLINRAIREGTLNEHDQNLAVMIEANARDGDTDTRLVGMQGYEKANLTKTQTRSVQKLLQAGGYYDGPLDGLWGAGTTTAFAKYETDFLGYESATGEPHFYALYAMQETFYKREDEQWHQKPSLLEEVLRERVQEIENRRETDNPVYLIKYDESDVDQKLQGVIDVYLATYNVTFGEYPEEFMVTDGLRPFSEAMALYSNMPHRVLASYGTTNVEARAGSTLHGAGLAFDVRTKRGMDGAIKSDEVERAQYVSDVILGMRSVDERYNAGGARSRFEHVHLEFPALNENRKRMGSEELIETALEGIRGSSELAPNERYSSRAYSPSRPSGYRKDYQPLHNEFGLDLGLPELGAEDFSRQLAEREQEAPWIEVPEEKPAIYDAPEVWDEPFGVADESFSVGDDISLSPSNLPLAAKSDPNAGRG